jgi:hypothetical protein
MLASISPLGERARGNRWGRTAAAYAAGSIAAAGLLGALLGWAGAVAGIPSRWSLAIFGVAAAAAGVVDLMAHRQIPTIRRQVNEDWLTRYRGWVYGVGFGAQLGVGVATVVTTATVYAWIVGAAVAGSAPGSAIVGVAFGVARTLPLVLVARARTARSLRRVIRAVSARATTARVVAAASALGLGLLAGVRA